MNLNIRNKLSQQLLIVKGKLNDPTNEILDDLIAKLGRVIVMRRGADNSVSFKTEFGMVAFGCLEGVLKTLEVKDEHTKTSGLEDIQKNQLASFAENEMYTEGTSGLLELLIQYRYIKTEKVLITATPDIHVYRNGRASIYPGDLKEYYDDTRTARVLIIYEDGFIVFDFTEKVIGA